MSAPRRFSHRARFECTHGRGGLIVRSWEQRNELHFALIMDDGGAPCEACHAEFLAGMQDAAAKFGLPVVQE
jgi:hypothetical protein